ncbi:unnamed protein product, partial [Staurois parvus]
MLGSRGHSTGGVRRALCWDQEGTVQGEGSQQGTMLVPGGHYTGIRRAQHRGESGGHYAGIRRAQYRGSQEGTMLGPGRALYWDQEGTAQGGVRRALCWDQEGTVQGESG